jgi:DNA-binding NarL/FixJ family response regulator
MKPYNVIIIDDHALVAKGIRLLIDSLDNYQVLDECRNGKEFVERNAQNKKLPDIILLDINMPVMNGFETMEWMNSIELKIPVLALSINNDDESVIKMLRLGVKGYLSKDTDADELLKAMNTILTQGFYYSDIVNSKLLRNLNEEPPANVDSYTLKEREIEFLNLACTELTYAQIAEQMFLSPKSVDHYREALFEKFDVKSRIGLVLFAIKNKLFKVDLS